jgi:hypothetical protein
MADTPSESPAPLASVAAAVIEKAPAAPAQFPVSLDEFCTDLSRTDRRVELISMFHFIEKQAGHRRALPSEFRQRFADLSTKKKG